MKWISVNDRFPDEGTLTWLYCEKDKTIFLGSRDYVYNQGWFWSCIEGGTYINNGKICADCYIDDLDVTHWMPLPEPPAK